MTGATLIRILMAVVSVMPVALNTSAQNPITLPEARDWCEKGVLAPIEGVWEYPADGVVVLIKRSDKKSAVYDITVLESEDSRLQAGTCIGRLTETPDANSFRLSQYSAKKDDVLSGLMDCSAKLTSDKCGICVSTPKLKLRMNPTILLPGFWKVVRFSFTSPGDKIPEGLVRRYPLNISGSRQRRAL